MSDLTTYDELNDILQEIYPAIGRAAKSVAAQWPGVVESEDVLQAIATRLWESPGSLRRISKMEDKPRYRAIVGIGHQLASQERSDYDFYKGSFRYGVDEVKKLLNRGVLIEPLDGFDAAVFDLMEGLEAMVEKKPQYVDAITKRYADEVYPSTTSAKDALKNGLTSLTNEMNKSNRRRFSERDDGIGTRTVISNAQALEQSSSDWDGVDE